MNQDDRRVHAYGDGYEIVRYDRAGKWWIEASDFRSLRPARRVTLSEAVEAATLIARQGLGQIYWNQPGGQQFDARLRKALAR